MPWNTVTYERLIHSFKTGLACLIGYTLTRLIHFPVGGQWLIVTIIVVMCAQINVGSMLQKSYMRFFGTLSGSIIAALTLTFFDNSYAETAAIITLSIAFFSYIATSEKSYSAAGTLGAVTVVIILISQNASSYMGAIERFLEISLGITIAALVSQFIFPINARSHLRRLQAKTLTQLHDYYGATLMTAPTSKNSDFYQNLDEAIVKSLSTQRELAKDSEQELLGGVLFDPDYFGKILRCEKEIFRCIICMHYAFKEMAEDKNILLSLAPLHEFHNGICNVLKKLALQLDAKGSSDKTLSFPSIMPLQKAFEAAEVTLSKEDTICLDAFLFCADRLVKQLKDLHKLISNADEGDNTPITQKH